jgi:hypothetical protein
MTLQHYIITAPLVLSYPLSHFLFKKAMILDNNLTNKRHKLLGRFFFIPFINVAVMLLYLIWMLIKLEKID